MVFIRSENLFFRPAWPEDRTRLDRIDVPFRHDPLRIADDRGLVITMPDATGARLIGTAGFDALNREWQPRVWLAPAWRHLGLFAEAEDSLADLAQNLPRPGGDVPVMATRMPAPLAA